jgi:hypothetical protein
VITDEAAEDAVDYLKGTSKAIGQARGQMEYREASLRRVKALEMLKHEGSLGEREAKAYASDAYRCAIEDHENAVAEYETLRALREAADWQLRVWQSETSSQRQGRV